jgi:heme/copper-type cytochrome/quinol oxidase subunit 3
MEIVEHSPASMEVSHGHEHGVSTEERNYLLKFGWWAYIASEVMLFSSLIGVFLLAKSEFPDQGHVLNIPLTSFNTFLLLMSSWTVVRALASAQEGNSVGVQRALFMSMALGTVFVLVQIIEYRALSHEGVTLSSNTWGSSFYVLTGFHGAHVIGGVIWLFRNFMKSLDNHFTPQNYIGLELMGLYWHFVDVVWIVLFTLIYLL